MMSLEATASPQTYIVAQNPEVLARLIKENEQRANPAAYTTPASVFNTVAVEFEKNAETQETILRTCPIPMPKLQQLDPEVPENAAGVLAEGKKMGTLERTPSRSSTGSATPKMGSLERKTPMDSPKMNSLEHNAHLIHSAAGSLEKSGMFSPKLGSLERKSRNTSPKMGSLERTNSHTAAFSPKMGSLERNTHMIPVVPPQHIIYDPDTLPSYHPEPVLYQFEKHKEMPQPFEEGIYDFGGADVKSCAHKQPLFYKPAKAAAVPAPLMAAMGPPVIVDNKFQEQRLQVRVEEHEMFASWLGFFFFVVFNFVVLIETLRCSKLFYRTKCTFALVFSLFNTVFMIW